MRESTSAQPDHSGVKFPPPFIFAASLLIGWVIHRKWPLRIVPPTVSPWLGLLLVALAFLLAALSFREFFRARTTFVPDRPTTAIIRTGPFGYTRNPLYLALSLLQVGVSIWVNSAWMAFMLAPALVVLRTRVIAREERYLERKFGRVYLDYKASVRRWL